MIKASILNGNKDKPKCSMYQCGLAVRDALQKYSQVLDISYYEIGDDRDIHSSINSADVVMVNYHPATIPINLDFLVPKKMGIIWDMMKEPWSFSGYKGFDFIGIPAPNMVSDDPKVAILNRIISERPFITKSIDVENPTISTFGFPAEYKDMLAIVEAINKEFDTATFRIKYAMGDHTPGSYGSFPQKIFTECYNAAKPGIKVEFIQQYMEMNDLISWLEESDLNIFLYGPERDQDHEVRMPTSVDQAIASHRPLALSDSRCVDHILEWIPYSYPNWTLRTLMCTAPLVEKVADAWSPKAFAEQIDGFLWNIL